MDITTSHKVLILGGSGFVGSHVSERLNELGIKMTVMTRRAPAKSVKYLPFVDVIEGDPSKPEVLKRAMKGHTAVINLIAILHGTEKGFEQLHERLPATIANACSEMNIKRLIHISALGAEQSAPSMYLRSKARGEQALHSIAQTKGLNLTLFRPSVLFGEDDKFINVFAKLQKTFPFIPLACADATFQPVWVVDVAHAVAYALLHPQTANKTFELVGPEVLSLKELVEFAGKVSHHNRPIFALPPFSSYLQALVMEKLPGPTLMSRDNLLSMRVPNVHTGKFPGLKELGILDPQTLSAVFGVRQAKS